MLHVNKLFRFIKLCKLLPYKIQAMIMKKRLGWLNIALLIRQIMLENLNIISHIYRKLKLIQIKYHKIWKALKLNQIPIQCSISNKLSKLKHSEYLFNPNLFSNQNDITLLFYLLYFCIGTVEVLFYLVLCVDLGNLMLLLCGIIRINQVNVDRVIENQSRYQQAIVMFLLWYVLDLMPDFLNLLKVY
jgi:hypothetical protein